MNPEIRQKRTLESLVSGLAPDLSPDLKNQIIIRIHSLEKRALVFHLAMLGVLSLVSLCGVVVSFFSLGRAFAQTGFSEYLYLVFSEPSIVTTYWKEILLSLLESLPALTMVLVLLVFGLFVWSSTKTWTRAREIRRTA